MTSLIGTDEAKAIEAIRLGEPLASIAQSHRVRLCERAGVDPEEEEDAFAAEAGGFMRGLCQRLGDRHAGDGRIGAALLAWVERCKDYEAWDALLSGFQFEGRLRYLRRGKAMFPGPLTAHWGA